MISMVEDFYYLLNDAAVQVSVCVRGQYLPSLFANVVVRRWLCSVSVSLSEISTGWRVLPAYSSKLICLSDLKWCCFFLCFYPHTATLYSGVSTANYPNQWIHLSKLKPNYFAHRAFTVPCCPSKYCRYIDHVSSAVMIRSTSESDETLHLLSLVSLLLCIAAMVQSWFVFLEG